MVVPVAETQPGATGRFLVLFASGQLEWGCREEGKLPLLGDYSPGQLGGGRGKGPHPVQTTLEASSS